MADRKRSFQPVLVAAWTPLSSPNLIFSVFRYFRWCFRLREASLVNLLPMSAYLHPFSTGIHPSSLGFALLLCNESSIYSILIAIFAPPPPDYMQVLADWEWQWQEGFPVRPSTVGAKAEADRGFQWAFSCSCSLLCFSPCSSSPAEGYTSPPPLMVSFLSFFFSSSNPPLSVVCWCICFM